MSTSTFGMIMHFFNEELLMPSFCLHHRDMFDRVICIDHSSTDKSRHFIEVLCPEWEIVDTKLSHFDAALNDIEVMEWEQKLGTDFKIALNTTEYIWHPDFKKKIQDYAFFNKDIQAFGMRSFCLVDKEKFDKEVIPFYKFRSYGYLDQQFAFNVMRHRRFVHRSPDGQYTPGRHSVNISSMNIEDVHLLHATYSPWPDSRERKLQIQTRMPESDKIMGRGVQHIQSPQTLEEQYQRHLAVSGDLLEDMYFFEAYTHFLAKDYTL